MPELSCFVIIGYGKKTSYALGRPRILDLDQTYSLLIKPVFDALNIPCHRAIDKNLTGSIDKLMLEEIQRAPIALVDISTLNPNVMWELGVRHSLRDKYTIMICEKEQVSSIPFDIRSFVVHSYTHSEEGIPYIEVDRFRKVLTDLMQGILNGSKKDSDSPVFTFLNLAQEAATPVAPVAVPRATAEKVESMAELLDKAAKARKNNDFPLALECLGKARAAAESNISMLDNITYIVCQQALCTYKSKQPTEIEALREAEKIMARLNPDISIDPEITGLSGAIAKRLFDLTNDPVMLDRAIAMYEKGFMMKQDYYNGINTIYVLLLKMKLLKSQGHDASYQKMHAETIRQAVLMNTSQLEADPDFKNRNDALWILLTIAEACHYGGEKAKMLAYEEKARQLAEQLQDKFAMASYQDQKKRIDLLMAEIV